MSRPEYVFENEPAMSAITCAHCGEKLPERLVALVYGDTDFFEHGDHLASWDPTPENFAEARRCARPSVGTYRLVTPGGRRIRTATKVTFADGYEVKFLDLFASAQQAIKQAEEVRARD